MAALKIDQNYRPAIFTAILLTFWLCFLFHRISQAEELAPSTSGGNQTVAATNETKQASVAFPKLEKAAFAQFKMIEKVPFGGRLAFTVTVGKYDRILELDLSTGSTRALIDGPGNNEFPVWSPDGSKLAFVSDRDGNKEIYIADWDGESQTRITNNTAIEGNPDWHPKGESLVYFRDKDQKNSNLFSSNIESGEVKQLTSFRGRNTTPKFSRDGTAIIYSTSRFWPGWDICRWDLLSLTEQCLLKGDESYSRPAWTISGSGLAYSYGEGNDLDIGFLSFSDLEHRIQSTSLPGREYDPVFAKDSNYLFFVAENGKKDLFNIWFKKQGAPEPKQLLSSPFSIRYLSWTEKSLMTLEAERFKAIEAAKRKRPEDYN